MPAWKKRTVLHIFLCVDAAHDDTLKKERKLDQLLRQLRILGRIKIVTWDNVKAYIVDPSDQSATESDMYRPPEIEPVCPIDVKQDFLYAVNELVKVQCDNTVVTFMYLPRPPKEKKHYATYIKQLEVITNDLPPTVLVHGVHPVTSTTL